MNEEEPERKRSKEAWEQRLVTLKKEAKMLMAATKKKEEEAFQLEMASQERLSAIAVANRALQRIHRCKLSVI